MSEELVFPVLMGEARARYGTAIRAALLAEGWADLPRGSGAMLGGLRRFGAWQRSDLADRDLRRAAALEERGLVRWDGDRLHLTEAGEPAGRVVNDAVDRLNARWADEIGADAVATTRLALEALLGL